MMMFDETFLRALFIHPNLGLCLSNVEIEETIAMLKHGQVYSWSESHSLRYDGRNVFVLEEDKTNDLSPT